MSRELWLLEDRKKDVNYPFMQVLKNYLGLFSRPQDPVSG